MFCLGTVPAAGGMCSIFLRVFCVPAIAFLVFHLQRVSLLLVFLPGLALRGRYFLCGPWCFSLFSSCICEVVVEVLFFLVFFDFFCFSFDFFNAEFVCECFADFVAVEQRFSFAVV